MTTLTRRPPRDPRPTGQRRSRRRDTPSPVRVVIVGLLVIGALALLGYEAVKAPNGLPFVKYRTLYASVPNPGNLEPHSQVRIAGVQVGQVIAVRASHGRSLITMKLGSGTRQLPTDTQVLVRADGLLGARYIQLVPGTSAKTLPNGATINGGIDSLTYGVPDLLDTFNAKTRGALGDSLNGLGVGLLNRGADLNGALGIAPTTARNFQSDTAAVLQVPGAAHRLIPALNQAAQALEGARVGLVRSFTPTREALTPLVQHSVALSQTLEQAPATLTQANSGLSTAERLLVSARSLARAARQTLPAAPAALAATTVLLDDSHTPLARADTLLNAAVPTVPAALRTTSALQPVLAPVKNALTLADPIVLKLGEYGCNVYNMTSNWRSALGYGDNGSGPGAALPSGDIGELDYFRVNIIAGTSSVQGVSGPETALGYSDPYPTACKYAPGTSYFDPAPGLGDK